MSKSRLWPLLTAALLGLATLTAAFHAQEIVPPLTGAHEPMADFPVPPIARTIVDDIRRMRNYPEQPPVIPHAIDGYQLTLNTNRCLDCHKRELNDFVRAPMLSFTHYMDRDGQMLADVAPRRYFCTACHVQQSDAPALVPNTFRDMLTLTPVDEE